MAIVEKNSDEDIAKLRETWTSFKDGPYATMRKITQFQEDKDPKEKLFCASENEINGQYILSDQLESLENAVEAFCQGPIIYEDISVGQITGYDYEDEGIEEAGDLTSRVDVDTLVGWINEFRDFVGKSNLADSTKILANFEVSEPEALWLRRIPDEHVEFLKRVGKYIEAIKFLLIPNPNKAKDIWKDWAKKINDNDWLTTVSICNLAREINEELTDRDWGLAVMDSAVAKTNDVKALVHCASVVAEQFEDKDRARNFYKRAIENDDGSMLVGIIKSIDSYLEDNDWVLSLSKKAEDEDLVTSSCSLKNMAVIFLNKDMQKAIKFYKKSYSAAKNCGDLRALAVEIKITLVDRGDWALAIMDSAVAKAEDVNDLVNCAGALGMTLNDKERARSVFEQAVEMADDVDEYQEIAENIMDEDYLGDTDWAERLAVEHGFELDDDDDW